MPLRRYLRLSPAVLSLAVALAVARRVAANDIYLANENHTDYGWNASVAAYEASMLSELDYYLDRIQATANDPPAEQARFVADSWYYLWLYQQHRSSTEFASLLDAMRSGHIAVPLNPLVTLFGALPTEAAIRAGYYPGRIERAYGVHFPHAEYMENQTVPWGLVSIWAGSGVKYSWRGICGCASGAPFRDHHTDVFRWRGPDGRELLMKWYEFSEDTQSWGGYAEARYGLVDAPLQKIQAAIDHFAARGQTSSGLFGYGWDDVNSQTEAIVDAVRQWNTAHPGGDRAFVSNVIDYFFAVEPQRDDLPVLRGGWGNDWDLWPAAMSARTSQTRRAIERLRTVEAFAALIHSADPTFWPDLQPQLADGLLDYFRYFEHAWANSTESPKKAWADGVDDAVSQAESGATARLAALFATGDDDRFVVVNPLAFERTDYADVPVAGTGPFVVTDVATGATVASQMIATDSGPQLRVLAREVPSLGYRVYRYIAAAGSPLPNAATITGNRIESDHFRVDLGARGQINSLFDKTIGREVAATGLNDFGSGASGVTTAENVGPVSATLRIDIPGQPARRVRVTLLRDVDRVDIDDEILANYTAEGSYRFDFNLAVPSIRFEEVGAIARPGLVTRGGDFLPGTRGDFMTLNHFVTLAEASFNVVLSNWDGYAMRVGNSAAYPFDFDLPTSNVSVLATGNPAGNEITDQGGDDYFRNRFALIPSSGPPSSPDAMRASLAHQNPLRSMLLPRNQSGPFSAPTATYLSVDAPNVIVTAFKPAEEGERGLIVRAWELDGEPTTFTIDASALGAAAAFETTLIETDLTPRPLNNGHIDASIGANEIKSYRILLGTAAATPTATPTAAATTTATITSSPTGTRTRTRTATPTRTVTGAAVPSTTPAATRTPTLTPSALPASTLAAAIGPADLLIPIAGAGGFPSKGAVRIDSELIAYAGRFGENLVAVRRGAGTTVPGAHTAGSLVTYVPPCSGDCDGDFRVRINELVVGVDIALGTRHLEQCPFDDIDADAAVGIDELVAAVMNAVTGCR